MNNTITLSEKAKQNRINELESKLQIKNKVISGKEKNNKKVLKKYL